MTKPVAALVAIVLALGATSGCGPSADEELLTRSWSAYTTTFIAPDGRVMRPENGRDTVSEGQAYALLRAAWMNDRATFARVWQWTRTNLGRQGKAAPTLLAWHWAPGAGVTDWNVASDADADVALALLLAAKRWPGEAAVHRDAAREMLADLIDHVVATDEAGVLQFLPGAWADERGAGRGLVLNPSYLAPASFRVFHQATGDARWLALIDSAYTVLEATCGPDGTGMPPDWLRWWSMQRWMVERPETGGRGWESIRVPWRIATDWLWFGEPRARAYLDRCVAPVVRRQLAAGEGMAVEPAADGQPAAGREHVLANALYSFALGAPAERERLLTRVAGQLVQQRRSVYFGEPDRYYVNSLAWLPFLARAGRYAAP